MKVLWIVNMLLPDAASHLQVATSASGSWMVDASRLLASTPGVQLAVACVYGSSYQKLELGGITYYLLPGSGKNMLFYTKAYETLWQEINEEFQPELVHIHGTEYSHGLAFLRACPQVKALISMQGLLTRICQEDLAGISPFTFLRYRTLKETLHFNGPIERHFLNRKNAKYEQEMLRRVSYINGINTWDISLAKSINPQAEVFQSEYILREEMYKSEKWDISNIQRHTIFTNPGGDPLKGLHQLIKAAALLKDKYPDIRIAVPGMGAEGKLVAKDSYSKYLARLIKDLNMEDHVEFLGRQTAQQMCENMRRANAVVVPSAIEGTSLILREAMFLGCPVIAAFRGGMADFISDKQDGFLYDFPETAYLAARIDQVFADDSLCQRFSQNAMQKAETAHERQKNQTALLDMYRQILT